MEMEIDIEVMPSSPRLVEKIKQVKKIVMLHFCLQKKYGNNHRPHY